MKENYDKLILFLKKIDIYHSILSSTKESIIEYNLQNINVFTYKYYSVRYKFAYDSTRDVILFKGPLLKEFITIANIDEINDYLIEIDDYRFKQFNFKLFLKCNLI